MLDEGVWAEIKAGDVHLRLFSEQSAQGVQASVFNVTAKQWIAPSETVEDIEQGKDRAAAHASAYLMRTANLEPPSTELEKIKDKVGPCEESSPIRARSILISRWKRIALC